MRRSLRFLAFFPFALCAPLAAQGLLVGPDLPPIGPPDQQPWPRPRTEVVRIVRTTVSADIVDGVATTTIDQVFRNDGTSEAEGTWFLPLPSGAVADGFTMTVGGKEVKGEVLDAGQARAVYEAIVRKRRDPGLLEYAGEGMLRARIYPIPPNGEVGATVRLRQVLQPTGGLLEWRWPLRASGLGDTSSGPIGVSVRLESQTPISTVLAPVANAEIRRIGEHEATVSFEGKQAQFEDLSVLYGLTVQEFGLHLLAHRPLGEQGYFTMLLSPPRALPAGQTLPRRCVQFVVDTSGSMAGAKIEQAKLALSTFLQSLRPTDLFQVVTFASAVNTFFDQPVVASADNLAVARRRIEQLTAMGGTNIAGALQQAFEAKMPVDDGGLCLPQIVFVTDGQPTVGLTAPEQILALAKQIDRSATRLFALGVGDEIDVRLLDDLVQQHRGARDFVRNKEKIEVKVDALCQKIAQPALTDVEVRCDGIDSFDVHPASTRDLFCGEMLQVVGRYREGGKRTVVVRGKQNGVEREYAFPVEFPMASEQHAFVQTLWARQHVASLLDAIRRNGPQAELLAEVKRLATRYGIVTPYTSQLIVEESMRLAGGGGRGLAPGAGARPEGWADRDGGKVGSDPASGAAVVPGAPAVAKSLEQLGSARTGVEAIEESMAVNSVAFTAQSVNPVRSVVSGGSAAVLRIAAGRVFLLAGADLVEQGLPAEWQKQAVAIDTYSPEQFELLRLQPSLRSILALGERVVFRDGQRLGACGRPPLPAKPPVPVVK